jgi:hypothetical protein
MPRPGLATNWPSSTITSPRWNEGGDAAERGFDGCAAPVVDVYRMRVHVDYASHDDLAVRIHHPNSALHLNLRGNRLDTPRPNADVAATDILAGYD